MSRLASCNCGQLRLICTGEPLGVSICHCLECQKRTGSIFATQARYPREGVTIDGSASQWMRLGDSGGSATFNFCLTCGSTVYWIADSMREHVTIAVGAFADPSFPVPNVSVYEEREHPWALKAGELPLDHLA